jgi:hypothetical protein
MRFRILCLALLSVTALSSAQIQFKKGYFIDNNNLKVNCFIKNSDWKNNPVEFEYKQDINSNPEIGTIKTIKEFGIYDLFKYVRETIDIDRTNDNPNKLKYDKNPNWSNENLFLNVLVEGKASLYYYEDQNLQRFFYSVDDSAIKQLVYKKYVVQHAYPKYNYLRTSFVTVNNSFHDQLWSDVLCPNITVDYIDKIDYKRDELEKYFIRFNECSKDSFRVFTKDINRKSFTLKITPGINHSTLALYNGAQNHYNSEQTIRIGLETEFLLPFDRDKWGIIIEPSYQYLTSEMIFNTRISSVKKTFKIDYQYIELPVGARHYFYLNGNKMIFVNVLFIPYLTFNFNSSIDIDNTHFPEVKTRMCAALGGGLDYKRFSAEIRCYSKQEIGLDYSDWTTHYNRISFILGYKLFRL